MDKEDVMRIYDEKLLSHKKEQNGAMLSNIDETTHYILNKTERQTPCGITYMWNLEYGTDELTYETERLTDIENKLLAAKGKAVWEGWTGSWGYVDANYHI